MAVNGFGIELLLVLTMVTTFLKFVRVYHANSDNDLAEAPAVEMVDRRDQILQRSAQCPGSLGSSASADWRARRPTTSRSIIYFVENNAPVMIFFLSIGSSEATIRG
jgi:hypothetical protein